MGKKFPKGFFWGAATSSHQVEGGNHNDWTEWEHANSTRLATEAARRHANAHTRIPEFILHPPEGGPGPLDRENYISGAAADHYHRFREDFDLAKSLGHNAHRLSIEWSRIEPTEGTFDEQEIARYREVIKTLRERGIEPFITIWHFTLPLWLRNRGGVLAKNFPHYFEGYTEKLAEAFRDDVTFWITINEPEIYSLNSYFRGIWPPQKSSAVKFYQSMAKLIAAYQRAYHAIKKMNPYAHVGAALNIPYFESAGGLVNDTLVWTLKRAWSEHFLRHNLKTLDFIGLNYYFHNRIDYGFNKNANKKTSDMGWELYPKGIEKVLDELTPFKKPIYITENGLADARDLERADFIKETLASVAHAIERGADVRGYFHWSLLDNFEWDKGFWPRFGLIHVDYKTQKRTVRQSAKEYARFIREYSD